MYDEQQAIIREIVARPDDDLPRLIYADWLDERGDPQGEFIRIQCALARGEQSPDETRELRERETELLREYRREWVARVSDGIVWHQFARGLVEDVVVDGELFFRSKGRLLVNSPVLGLGLKLRSLDDVQHLARMPEFAQLLRLRLGDSVLGDEGLQILTQSPYFPALRGLWLSRCQIGAAGIAAMVRVSTIRNLQTLVIDGNPIDLVAIRLLARYEDFQNLQVLSLKDCPLEDDAGRLLLDSAFPKLRELQIWSDRMSYELRTALWNRTHSAR